MHEIVDNSILYRSADKGFTIVGKHNLQQIYYYWYWVTESKIVIANKVILKMPTRVIDDFGKSTAYW